MGDNINAVLVYKLPRDRETEALDNFLKEYIDKVIYEKGLGLQIYFRDYDFVRASILKREMKVAGTPYRIYPLVTNLVVCGIGNQASKSQIERWMASYGPMICYYVAETKELQATTRGYVETTSKTDDLRIILNVPEVLANFEGMEAGLRSPELGDRSFKITFFCRLCRQNGHKQYQCPVYFHSEDRMCANFENLGYQYERTRFSNAPNLSKEAGFEKQYSFDGSQTSKYEYIETNDDSAYEMDERSIFGEQQMPRKVVEATGYTTGATSAMTTTYERENIQGEYIDEIQTNMYRCHDPGYKDRGYSSSHNEFGKNDNSTFEKQQQMPQPGILSSNYVSYTWNTPMDSSSLESQDVLKATGARQSRRTRRSLSSTVEGFVAKTKGVLEPHRLRDFLNQARRKRIQTLAKITENLTDDLPALARQLQLVVDAYYGSGIIGQEDVSADIRYIENLRDRLLKLAQNRNNSPGPSADTLDNGMGKFRQPNLVVRCSVTFTESNSDDDTYDDD